METTEERNKQAKPQITYPIILVIVIPILMTMLVYLTWYSTKSNPETGLKNSLAALLISVFIALWLIIKYFKFFKAANFFRRLEEIERTDEFISVATHELKTPITVIRGHISNLVDIEGQHLSEGAKLVVDSISAQAERLDSLVNNLLNVSRLEHGRLSFDLKPVKIDLVIKETIDGLSLQAKSKSLELAYQEIQNIPAILVDIQRIREIFTNIIGNAVKYTKEGKIEIYHELDGESLKTIIKDTGIGISKEALPHIFEKFYRAKNARNSGASGTGLGLWLTKEMVEKMGGKITLNSIENAGSEFTITFPVLSMTVG